MAAQVPHAPELLDECHLDQVELVAHDVGRNCSH
jgi:hypothetical protein